MTIKFAYPGSFDPWTKGHESILFSFLNKDIDANVEIIIGNNQDKKYTFTPLERKYLIEQSIPIEFKDRIKISIIDGVIANYIYTQNIPYIIKGVRDTIDFQYEANLAQINSYFPGSPLTLLVPQTETNLGIVSSTNLKMLANMGIKLDKYASSLIREAIKLKTTGKLFYGVCGGIASGKSTLCKELVKYSNESNGFGYVFGKLVKIYHINMDEFGHTILNEKVNVLPLYVEVRKKLVKIFSNKIENQDGTINRKILGEIVFNNKEKLDILTNITIEPILYLMSEKIKQLNNGIVLIESAILLERNLGELVDDNIIYISTKEDIRLERMMERGLTKDQAKRRINSQKNFDEKINLELDKKVFYVEQDYNIEAFYKTLEIEYFKKNKIGAL